MDKELELKFKQLQKRVMENKKNHGFVTDDLNLEILLLYGEVSEFFQGSLKKDLDNMKEELADIAIYLLGISEMLNINLFNEILKKMDINERRVYHSDGSKTLMD